MVGVLVLLIVTMSAVGGLLLVSGWGRLLATRHKRMAGAKLRSDDDSLADELDAVARRIGFLEERLDFTEALLERRPSGPPPNRAREEEPAGDRSLRRSS